MQHVLRNGVETQEGYYIPKNLKKLVITSGFEKTSRVCSSVFENCTTLEEIELPANIEAINNSAFENCTALRKVILQEGLTTIGAKAFYGCTNLLSVVVPKSVYSIGYRAFGKGTAPLLRREKPDYLPPKFNPEFCDKDSAVWNFKH